MKGERLVGSLRCGEVLERLPDFVAGTLEGAERAAVEAHLSGCDVCDRFGSLYQAAIAALRSSVAPDSRPAGRPRNDGEGPAR